MPKAIAILLLCLPLFIQAQVPDFIQLKKPNGRTLKSYWIGGRIQLQTATGSRIEGPIQDIRNDSVFVQQFIARPQISPWGFPVWDTMGYNYLAIHYKDIARIKYTNRNRFLRERVAPLMIIGGIGYLGLNAFNGGFRKEALEDRRQVARLRNAALLALAGGGLAKILAANGYSKPRHRIVYVRMR